MKTRKNICKILSLFLFGLFAVLPVHAVDQYVTVIYKQVDVAFVDKNDKELNQVLGNNVEDNNYYLIENYTMKKIRRLVVDEDYQFAMQANLVVIDNNLDNMEAVELYSTIANALEKQQEQEKIQAQKDAAAYAKYVAEKEKRKNETVKLYQTSTTADGKDVYIASKEDKYTATNWEVKFNLADLMIINDAKNGYNSVRYGIGGDFKYDYTFDQLTVGVDAGMNFIMLPFTNSDNTMLPDVYVMPKIGLGSFGRYFMIRAGFVGLMNMHLKDNEGSDLTENFFTPAFGISLNHLEIGPGTLSLGADYYLSSLPTVYSNMRMAFGGDLNYAVNLAKMDRVAVTFNIGAKDTLFVKDTGIENRATIVLAVGAENVAK